MFEVKLSLIACLVAITISRGLSKSVDGCSQSLTRPAPTLVPTRTTQSLNPVPDVCKSGFDAVCDIERDQAPLYFKDAYFWKEGENGPKEIRSAWPELPANLTNVDAVFNPFVDQVWFFIETEIFIFDGEQLKEISSLQEIGIDETKYTKIDAIFQWPDEDHTFIFSGEDYWRFNVSWMDSKVYDGYPQKIESVWKNAGSIDTVITDIRIAELQFLKVPLISRFDPVCMQVDWSPSGDYTYRFDGRFFRCQYDTEFSSRTSATSKCEKPDYETASEDARWIMIFFNNRNKLRHVD